MKIIKNNLYYVITLTLMILISIFFIWNFNTVNTTKLDEVKLKENISNNSIAIMLEKEDKTGYEETNDNSFPTYSYMFNAKLSGCIDNAGNEIENALTFNYTNNTVKIKTIGSTSCYMYFDYLFDGEGTESEPYLIQNIEDLVELSNAVNEGNTYSNYYFSLTRTLNFEDTTSYVDSTTKRYGDINDNGIEEELLTELTTGSGFTPIGASELNMYFKGNFDGNENSIENLYIASTSIVKTLGLFGFVSDATISNLGVSGNISNYNDSTIGGIIGSGKNTTIYNCYNKATIMQSNSVGSTGGLAGYLGNSSIINSYNIGTIGNGNDTGGLVGFTNSLIISNSYNNGNLIKEFGSHFGGLIGRDSTNGKSLIIVTNSYNIGTCTISNNSVAVNLGGLIGRIDGSIKVDNFYNKCNINVSANSMTYDRRLGGIIGFVRNNNWSDEKIVITNSYNDGTIINGTKTGGIIGYIVNGANIQIINTINFANIYSEDVIDNIETLVGGMIGFANNSPVTIINCSNVGYINSSEYVSGLIAGHSNSQINVINSYNAGNVLGIYSAGVVRTNSKIYIFNSYNIGNIIGTISNYGIISMTNDTYNVTNAYHQGTISGSNIEGITTPMSESDMKNETFVNILNNNISNINLGEIDESLSEYTLSTWKIGNEGYPVFSYQE